MVARIGDLLNIDAPSVPMRKVVLLRLEDRMSYGETLSDA
jgi:hypothetical protein